MLFHHFTRSFSALRLSLIGLLLTLGILTASAQPIPNPTAALSPRALPPIEYMSQIGGRLGGLAVRGTLAYIGEGSAISVLDISDPTKPRRAAFQPLADMPKDLALAGDRLYVAAEHGLQIYDLRQPLSPRLLGSFATDQSATRVKIVGNIAYLLADDLLIIDVQNPAMPALKSSYSFSKQINDLSVEGNRAYLAHGDDFSRSSSGGMQVLDISNPALPKELGSFVLNDDIVIALQVVDGVAYLLSGKDGGFASFLIDPQLRVIDSKDPARPLTRSSIALGSTLFSLHSRLTVANARVYISSETDPLYIVSVSNPAAPTVLRASETLGGDGGIQLIGDRLFLLNGGIDIGEPGFQIVSLQNPAAPQLVGSYSPLSFALTVTTVGSIAAVGASNAGLHMIDLTDPARPWQRSRSTLLQGHSQQRSGAMLYMLDYSGSLHIFDVADPDQPLLLSKLQLAGGQDVRVVGKYAYVIGGGFSIVDISEPYNPQLLGSGAQQIASEAGIDMAGSRAYLATGNQGLVIFDVSDPRAPRQTAIYSGLDRYSDVAIVGNRAYVAAFMNLAILDISDPDKPALLGKGDTPGLAYYVEVIDGLAYVADYYLGIKVFDVRDPANPVLVARYDTPYFVQNLAVEADLIAVAAGSAGLHTLRLHRDRLIAQAPLGPAGGQLSTIDGGVRLALPAGALASSATLTVTPTLDLTSLPGSGRQLLRAMLFDGRSSSGQPISQLGQPGTLTLTYTDNQLAALKVNERSLRIVAWDGSRWAVPPACAGCGVDPAANRVTLKTSQLGLFALEGQSTYTSALPMIK